MTKSVKPACQRLADDALAGVTGGATNGTSGDDLMIATADETGAYAWTNGLGGNDILVAFSGNHVLLGGDGDDILSGGSGRDVLVGEAGHDWATAGAGDDFLFGGEGNDTMVGGIGTDTAYGGEGDDTYVWGANTKGEDVFLGDGGTNTLEVQVILSQDEYGGRGDQVRSTLAGEEFTVNSETKWELVDGRVVFEGPASGSFTMNGNTVHFHDVSVIKAASFG